MKKLYLLFSLLILLGSCNRYIAPVFTDVERISQLRPNMSLKQMVDILGIEPYNIYNMQEDGSMVVVFNYRLKMRRVVAPTFNQDEFNRQTTNDDSQTSGDEFYSKDYKTLYAIINDNKLVSYTTTDGIRTSEIVLLNSNNLNIISDQGSSTYQSDSISNAEAVHLTHGAQSFKVSSNRDKSIEKESLFKRLFKN